jgi:asparagine synthase (glutamine-hydrolysing)
LFSPSETERLLGVDVTEINRATFGRFAPFFERVADIHYVDQAAYVDVNTWLVDDIFVKVDRASMAHGLEVRSPLLDYRIAEFSASLPTHMKLHGFRTKYLLRKLHARYFPPALRPKRKLGFNAPIAHWLASQQSTLRDFSTSPLLQKFVDGSEVERLWVDHLARSKDNGYRLFALACLGAWLVGWKNDIHSRPKI